MEPWLVKLASEVQVISEEKIKEWGGLVNRLGMSEQNRTEWTDIFKREVRDIMSDLILDVAHTQESLFNKIEALLKKSEELCKQLNIQMPSHDSSNLGLYNDEKELLKRVNELEEEVTKRLEDLLILKSREKNVCEHLGKIPIKISESPLPTREQIDEYINHIEILEKEREARKRRFKELKSEILDVVRELNLKPTLDFEKMVLDQNDDLFTFTDSNMNLLQNFHESVIEQFDSVKNEIESLRERIVRLWEILQQDLQDCNAFLEKHPGNSIDTLEALQLEMERCEELKRANIKVFIHKLREEMTQLWEKCKFAPEQRNKFEYFLDNLYTEDLLTLHDMEINRLKKYYKDNSEIYELLDKREAFWSKMLELEERSTAPDRYKNRGGQLLKEEKERNTLMKRIPKMEDKLLELTTQYEIKHGEIFLYWGEPIDTVIKKSHDNYEEDKKLKSSARKQRDITTVTPAKLYMSTAPSSSCIKRTLHVPSNPSPYTPMKLTASSKRIKNTPMSTVKRFKPVEDASRKGLRTTPGISKTKLRYSTEKKKRIEMLRRLSKSMQKQESDDSCATATTNYAGFKRDLTSRGACRSTLFSNDNCLTPIKITPCKLFKTTSAQGKPTPKFSTAKNLKMLI